MVEKLLEFLYRWPSTAFGAITERVVVGLTGHSPVNWLAARLSKEPYHRPLLLITIGARSGRHRSVVLPFYTARDTAELDSLVVIGSNGGAPSDPHWVHNLRASPEAWIRLGGRKSPVSARVATGEERERLWSAVTGIVPLYLDYQRMTESLREIPVVVLDRR